MIDQERINWLTLARTTNIGAITFHRLISKYKTATDALNALPDILRGKKLELPNSALIEQELKTIEKLNAQLLCAYDSDYPVSLAETEDAPPVLIVRGDVTHLNRPVVAIVGSRNCSLNGRRFAFKLAQDLGALDYCVASGLARGIDTSAHEGSLQTGTIAVVGGGVDVIYPPENQKIYHEICEKGVVVSEHPCGLQPMAQHFPKRNRIITGLSVGVVVIEANPKSGSLISARTAAEQGRDVMAVPGFPADPRSAGTNQLIRDGAALVRNIDDVMECISGFKRAIPHQTRPHGLGEDEADIFENPPSPLNKDEILNHLTTSPTAIDELCRACHTSPGILAGKLLELELEGLIQRLPGNRVAKLDTTWRATA